MRVARWARSGPAMRLAGHDVPGCGAAGRAACRQPCRGHLPRGRRPL